MGDSIINRLMALFGRQRRDGGSIGKPEPARPNGTAAAYAGSGSTGGISGGSEGNPARPAGGDMFGLGIGAASISHSAGSDASFDSDCGDSGGGDFGGGGDCGGGGS